MGQEEIPRYFSYHYSNKKKKRKKTSRFSYIRTSLLVPVLLVSDCIMPRCVSQADNQVSQDRAIISSMPMRRTRRCPDNVSSLDAAGLTPLIANPAGAGHHLQELALPVGVPVCPSAWSEGNIGDGSLVVLVYQVHINIASECGGRLRGSIASLGGAMNNG